MAAKGKGGGKRKETEEYELGDDFLADLDSDDDEDLDPETFVEDQIDGEGRDGEPAGDDDADEEEYEDDDLEEIVSAETVEWTPEGVEEEPEDEEPAESEAEQTLVAAEGGGAGRILGGVGSTLSRPFRWFRRHPLPIWARFTLASFLIVTSIAAATAISGLLVLSNFAEALRHHNRLQNLQDKLASVDPGEPQTIMIIGSDLQPVGKIKKFQGLSDTTMLLRLDPDRDAIALFSLPRDLKVDIPGYGVGKLNEAYTVGGPEKTLQVVQNLTRTPQRPDGIEVNHLV